MVEDERVQIVLETIANDVGIQETLKQLNLLERQLKEQVRSLNSVSRMFNKLKQTLSIFGNVLKKVKNGFVTMKKSIVELGNAMKKFANKAKLAFLSLVAVTSLAINSYSNFQKEMSNVNTLLGLNKEGIKQFEKEVQKLSKTTGKDGTELAKGLYDVVSAGVEGSKSVNVLEKAVRAATAGVTETNVAVKAGISTINAYGMEISELERVYDLQFSTVKKGIITYGELADSIGNVLPSASKLGVGLEEVYGSIAFLTKVGQGPADGATALARSFDAIIDKKDELKKLGIEVYDSFGQFRGYSQIIEEIAQKIDGLSDEGRNNIFEQIGFDIRAQRAVVSMTQNIDEFKSVLAEVADSAGAMETAYEKAVDNIDFAMKKAKQSIKVTYQEFGAMFEEEAVIIADAISEITSQFSKMDDESKDKLKNVVIGIGAVILAIAGIGTAIFLLTNPFTWIVATTATLVGAVNKNFFGMKDGLKTVFNWIGDSANKTYAFFVKTINKIQKAWIGFKLRQQEKALEKIQTAKGMSLGELRRTLKKFDLDEETAKKVDSKMKARFDAYKTWFDFKDLGEIDELIKEAAEKKIEETAKSYEIKVEKQEKLELEDPSLKEDLVTVLEGAADFGKEIIDGIINALESAGIILSTAMKEALTKTVSGLASDNKGNKNETDSKDENKKGTTTNNNGNDNGNDGDDGDEDVEASLDDLANALSNVANQLENDFLNSISFFISSLNSMQQSIAMYQAGGALNTATGALGMAGVVIGAFSMVQGMFSKKSDEKNQRELETFQKNNDILLKISEQIEKKYKHIKGFFPHINWFFF